MIWSDNLASRPNAKKVFTLSSSYIQNFQSNLLTDRLDLQENILRFFAWHPIVYVCSFMSLVLERKGGRAFIKLQPNLNITKDDDATTENTLNMDMCRLRLPPEPRSACECRFVPLA